MPNGLEYLHLVLVLSFDCRNGAERPLRFGKVARSFQVNR